MPPLLSIIIPTRNRQKYAISTITSILNIPSPDIELVVQDNSTSGELEEYVRKNLDDKRLVFHYSPEPLSMIDNFEAAVKSSTGRYLCIIGDDDGLNPEIVEATRWAETEGWDAVNPPFNVVYFWPGSLGPDGSEYDPDEGLLKINPYTGDISYPDPEFELRRLVRDGGLNYFLTGIPKLYHGVVSRKVIARIYEKTGSYFGGLSPDIYIAVAVANYAKKIASVNYPLTILGACEGSATAQSERGEHTGPFRTAPHFRGREQYEWSALVPRFYSVETIWADSIVAALTSVGRDDLLRDFNTPNLAAHCIVQYPKYFPIIIRDLVRYFRMTDKNWGIGMVRFSHQVATKIMNDRLNWYHTKISGRTTPVSTTKTYHNVGDIQEAIDILDRHLNQDSPKFMDLRAKMDSR